MVNIRTVKEDKVSAQLQASGFTVKVNSKLILKSHILVAKRRNQQGLGVLIYGRSQNVESPIYGPDDSIFIRFEGVCKQQNLQPYLAFYDDKSRDNYMTSLDHYRSAYRGSVKIPAWKMTAEAKKGYCLDKQVKHINISRWW